MLRGLYPLMPLSEEAAVELGPVWVLYSVGNSCFRGRGSVNGSSPAETGHRPCFPASMQPVAPMPLFPQPEVGWAHCQW